MKSLKENLVSGSVKSRSVDRWVGGRWVCLLVGKWSLVAWSRVGESVIGGFNKTRVCHL